jgi:hypothetical protein
VTQHDGDDPQRRQVGSQLSITGPSREFGFGKGAAGAPQIIVAGHQSQVLWSMWE